MQPDAAHPLQSEMEPKLSRSDGISLAAQPFERLSMPRPDYHIVEWHHLSFVSG